VAVSIEELQAKAKLLRKHIIRMTTAAASGHPSSSLSAVEMITALFFGGFMNYRPQEPHWPGRDRFILSKGHAVPALYAAMAEAGYFTVEATMSLRKLGSVFEGHPNMFRMPGIEASTGSLGQGEGQIWEAAASASKYKTSNLTCIVDQNGYQQTGATKDVLDLRPIADKFAAFGWHVQTVNGNCQATAVAALTIAKSVKDRPTCIVSQTQKGFGILPILEAEGDMNYPGKPLSPALAEKALALLG
jgi:transketolase